MTPEETPPILAYIDLQTEETNPLIPPDKLEKIKRKLFGEKERTHVD